MNMIGTNHRLATALSALALLTSAALLGGAAHARRTYFMSATLATQPHSDR